MIMSHPDHLPGHAPGYRAIRFNIDWIMRPVFGIFLAGVAIGALVLGPEFFAGLTVLVCLLAAREWHRLVRSPQQRARAEHERLHMQTIITAIAIALAVVALLARMVPLAMVLLVLGAVAAFLVARRRDDNPAWHALGVIYLGLPALSLVALRTFLPQGVQTIIGLFLIVWATDTGAMIFGKLIGGARMAPRLSPGKTWAGTIGGSLTAALIFGLYIGFFGFPVLLAMLFAFVFSFTAHGGDLFESLVKRRFGYKDSGALIPGHGGVLDRMDSLFAASVVMALLVFILHLNPMFGGHMFGAAS